MLSTDPIAAPGLQWAITVNATLTPIASPGFDCMIRLKYITPVLRFLQQGRCTTSMKEKHPLNFFCALWITQAHWGYYPLSKNIRPGHGGSSPV